MFLYIHYIETVFGDNMIKVFKNLLVALFIILSIIYMILEPEKLMSGVKFAIMLWSTKVFPVLFPFYIFSSLAIRYGVAHLIGDIIQPITSRLFKTSSISGFVFFMSLISGNPSSAIIIAQLYEENYITKAEAQHLISFCVFTNPLFILGTVGYAYFNNASIGYIILISHIAANILIGFLQRFNIKGRYYNRFSLKSAYQNMIKQKKKYNSSFGEVITTILQNGISIMFLIGGFMVFYNLIVVMIASSSIITQSYHYLAFILKLFKIDLVTYQAFFIGSLEMVLGIDNVIKSSFSPRIATTFITMLISFGGLSIHSQIQSILLKIKLKYMPFLFSRITQMFFSGIIAYYLFPLIYKEKTVNTSYIENMEKSNKIVMLLTIILLFITLIIILFGRNRFKKIAQ